MKETLVGVSWTGNGDTLGLVGLGIDRESLATVGLDARQLRTTGRSKSGQGANRLMLAPKLMRG